MDPKELSVTWNEHHRTLVGVFENLLESSSLVDCTIAAEGQYLRAHKVVLSACSPYFELLFKQENEKNPIVVLKDVKFQELKAVIDFVYRGKVKIPEDALGDFIATAESLQIKGLCDGQRRDVSEKQDFNSSIPKKDGHISPVLRKRVRRRHRSNHEENMSSFSSVTDITNERHSYESPPQNKESVDVPISFSSVLSTPSPNCSTSEVVYELRMPEEYNSVNTEPSTSYVQPMYSSVPLTETRSSHPSTETVIKSEPEPVEEIYLPETEDNIESKQELCAEELSLLEREDTMDIAEADNMCEENSTQFSNMPLPGEATDKRSNELHQMTGGNRSQGAALATAEGPDRRRCPTHAPRPRPRSRRSATCPQCGKVLGTSSSLARHMLRHTASRPHSCQECGKTFSEKGNLRIHLRMHKGERPFLCAECGKAFGQKIHLHEHELLHRGERPFVCQECGKAFIKMLYLKYHMRAHTGERPFLCAECGRSFIQMSHLQDHRLNHTGERPCVCQECGKAFKRKTALQKHMRIHTRK